MYKQYHPDLILMDIKMPRMNGLEATHIIRTYSKKIPIIALTAYAFETDKELALEAGCNDFVTKPISEKALRRALDKHSVTDWWVYATEEEAKGNKKAPEEEIYSETWT